MSSDREHATNESRLPQATDSIHVFLEIRDTFRCEDFFREIWHIKEEELLLGLICHSTEDGCVGHLVRFSQYGNHITLK